MTLGLVVTGSVSQLYISSFSQLVQMLVFSRGFVCRFYPNSLFSDFYSLNYKPNVILYDYYICWANN